MPDHNFNKGLQKDLADFLVDGSQWTHAKNLVNNTQLGDAQTLSTEAATKLCVDLPYPMIGRIFIEGSIWCVFMTDNTNSEIGLVDTDICTYTTITGNQPCLNFNQNNLITGVARRNYECGFNVYWSDGARNPDRVINTTKPPWIQDCTTTSGCVSCVDTNVIDCDKLRIAPYLTIPCVELTKSTGSGTLPNGMYQVAIAYAVNGIKVSNYVVLSNPQGLFSHNDIAGALSLTISNTDDDYSEMIVTVISFVKGNLVAKRLGVYSTRETTIYIANIDPTLVNEDISNIPLQIPQIEKSDSIWEAGSYLLRNGIYTKPEFNYQPLANKINTHFAVVEFDEDYYRKGGNNYSYMSDEVYCFFIRWIYNTGDKSASYHIPGRAYEIGVRDSRYTTENTAYIESLSTYAYDGGTVVATGKMSYWQSTEKYPDNKPAIWGTLCGQPIRHHKFPDQTVDPLLAHFTNTRKIRTLGVYFDNISTPVDNLGNPILNIVGYEILRGSREGNKTVVAKGMFNNLGQYYIDGYSSGTTRLGLYQNFPYNDIRPNFYLTPDRALINRGGTDGNYHPLQEFKNDFLSFHSPDTSFQHPFIGSSKIKVSMKLSGVSEGSFQEPYKHPMFKLHSNFIGTIVGVVGAVATTAGALIAIQTNNYSFTLTPTKDIPWSSPLGIVPNFIPEPTGTVGAATALLALTYNTILMGLTLPFQARVLTQQLIDVVTGLLPGVQYARQFNSHGFYNQPIWMAAGTVNPINIVNYQYVEGNVQFFENYEINNLFRNNYVALRLLNDIPALNGDTSRYTMTGSYTGSPELNYGNLMSYYGGIYVDIPSQYGQIGSVRQLPIGSCSIATAPSTTVKYTSPILFGGDTYINRYTEKNPFFLFNDWLVDSPVMDYDYREYINVPYPAFWIDNTKIYEELIAFASDNRRLDGSNTNLFYVKQGVFYLFVNGVRDFYVESEVNVGYRDWDEETSRRFYDPYEFTDLNSMFRSDIIKSDPLYKYDYSLSVNKFYSQYISFGFTLDNDYDPYLAYTCYDYYPRRINYSLPQTEELKVDNWRQFLPNNYYDLPTPLRAVKNVSKTGALFLLDEQSPMEFSGTQVLQANNIAITIGDGGLFNQPLQNIVNTDKGLNYASCKSMFSILNTPFGLFWVSQQSGKIFNYTGQLAEISNNGMKWWLAKYLPSQLLKQFPDYALADNPLTGIGVQCSYDDVNNMLYISKKDFKLKDAYLGIVRYDPSFGFYTTSGAYTCPTGWTLSGTTCVRTVAPLSSGTTYNCAPSTYFVYGQGTQYDPTRPIPGHTSATGSTLIYDTFNPSTGCAPSSSGFTVIPSTNPFWFFQVPPASCPTWGTSGYTGECDNGPVNRIMIWNDDGLTNYDVAVRGPVDTWVGFKQCVTLTGTTTYHVAIAADNEFRMTVDGTVVLQSNSALMSSEVGLTGVDGAWCYLHIYPITLTVGTHIIVVEGKNLNDKAAFGCEIYQNTKSEVIVANDYSKLNVFFTTRGKTEFNNITYECPAGYTASGATTPCDAPTCRSIFPATLDRTLVTLDTSVYFDDCSWTLSYDCKSKMFISFHDWNPDLSIVGRTHNLTSKLDKIWKHNDRCDLFANYYDVNYPTEIAFPVNTTPSVTTLKNVEYLLEAYQYKTNCQDKFQMFDVNFDTAMVYNHDQNSGYLRLNPKPTNPYDALQYPIISAYNINILYSLREHIYRFNNFWDVTKDRGEYSTTLTQMFLTSENGVDFTLNPLYLDYNKDPLQRKKFRNYNNALYLRKNVSNDKRLNLRMYKDNVQLSPR